MARCISYNWTTGACENYEYAGNYNVPFYADHSGQNDPYNPAPGQNPANPANPNAQNGAVTSFPGGANAPGSLFPDAGQGLAGILGNDGVWWLVLGAVALIALSGKKR